MDASKPTLGYWKIRGLGSNIRFQMAYSGVEYNTVEYEQGEGPDFSRAEWLDAKFTLGMPFPNLPYLFDGDLKLTETLAIHKYLADKYKPELLGKDAVANAKANMMAGVLMDFKLATTRPCYMGEPEKIKETCAEKLPAVIAFIGDHKFLIGDDVTYIDFFFYENLNLCKMALKDKCDTDFDTVYPKLASYMSNMRNLPGLKEYLDGDCVEKTYIFNNKVAKVNGVLPPA